jgi:hypothetical protein
MDNRHHDRRNPDDRPDGAGRNPFARDELVGDELLSAYLDGECTAAEQTQLEARVAANPELRQLVEELRGVRASLELLPQHRLEADFAQQVLRRAEREVLTGGAPVRAAADAPSKATPADAPPTIRPLADVSRSPAGRTSRAEQTRSARPFLWAMAALAAAVVILVTNRNPEIRPDPIARGPDINLPQKDIRQQDTTTSKAKEQSLANEESLNKGGERTGRAPGIVREEQVRSAIEEYQGEKTVNLRGDENSRLESDEKREKLATGEGLTPDAAKAAFDQASPKLRRPMGAVRARMSQEANQSLPDAQPAEPPPGNVASPTAGIAVDTFDKQAGAGETFRETTTAAPTTPVPVDNALGAAAATEAAATEARQRIDSLDARGSTSAGDQSYARPAEPLRVVEIVVTRAAWQRGDVNNAFLQNRIAVLDGDAETTLRPASGPAADEAAQEAPAPKKDLAENLESAADRKPDVNGEKAKAGDGTVRGEAKEENSERRGRSGLAPNPAPTEAPPLTSFAAGDAQDNKQVKKESEVVGAADLDRQSAIAGDRLEMLVVNATAAQIDATVSALGDQAEQQMQVVTDASAPDSVFLGESLADHAGFGGRGLSDLSGVADARRLLPQEALDRLNKGVMLQSEANTANSRLQIPGQQREVVGQSTEGAQGVPAKSADAPPENAPELPSTNKKYAAESNEAIEPSDLEDRIQQSQSAAPTATRPAPSAAEPSSRPSGTGAPAARRARIKSERTSPDDAPAAARPSSKSGKTIGDEVEEQAAAKDMAQKPALQRQKSFQKAPSAETFADQDRALESEQKANLDQGRGGQSGGGRPAEAADRDRQYKFTAPAAAGGTAGGAGEVRNNLGGGVGGASRGGAAVGGYGATVTDPRKALDSAGKPIDIAVPGATEGSAVPEKEVGGVARDLRVGGGFGGGGFGLGQPPSRGYAEPTDDFSATLPMGIATRVRLQTPQAAERNVGERALPLDKDAADAAAGHTVRGNQLLLGRDLASQSTVTRAARGPAADDQRATQSLAGAAAAEGKRDPQTTAEPAGSSKYDPAQPMPAVRQQAVFLFRIVDAPTLAARGERAGRAVEASKARSEADVAAEELRRDQNTAGAAPVPSPARPSPATLPAPQPAK